MVEPGNTLAALLGALLLAAPGGAAAGEPADRPLATVGSAVLRESDFERFLGAAFAADEAAGIRARPAARRQAIDAWLDLTVQAAKARDDGIDRLPTFRKALELMRMKLLVREMTDRNRGRLAEPADVSPAEIERFYQSHPDRFQLPRGAGRQPLGEVSGEIAGRLARERNARFHRRWLADLRAELGFRQTDAARPGASLLDRDAVPAAAVIALVGERPVTEADFQWFLRDAFRAEQRRQAFALPGARQRLLDDFLTMRLLEAKAAGLRLDRTARHRDAMELAELRLLAEFLLERDGMTPWSVPGETPEERAVAFAGYMRRMKAEVGVTLTETTRLVEAAQPPPDCRSPLQHRREGPDSR